MCCDFINRIIDITNKVDYGSGYKSHNYLRFRQSVNTYDNSVKDNEQLKNDH